MKIVQQIRECFSVESEAVVIEFMGTNICLCTMKSGSIIEGLRCTERGFAVVHRLVD